jgi:Tfp pilus assembly protein PilZ
LTDRALRFGEADYNRAVDRRATGLMRVPFIVRCALQFDGAPLGHAYLVNINILGSYVARDDLPHLGARVTLRFRIPETEREVELEGVVAWVNPRQQHPVHSLPPGFGVSFRELTDGNRRSIEGVVEEYIARHPVAP